MAGIKIVDLPPLGRDLASTDLLELSLAGGTGSRKITGQEIMNTSKLNIGTTAITSGTVGRVLFEGTGNVVQQSSSLFWDSTNDRLTIGTSTGTSKINLPDAGTTASDGIAFGNGANIFKNASSGISLFSGSGTWQFNSAILVLPTNQATFIRMAAGRNLLIDNGTTTFASINGTTGNVLINTTTDAGFRLDVNGTARVQGNTTVTGTIAIGSSSTLNLTGGINSNLIQGTQTIEYRSGGSSINRAFHYFTNSLTFNPTVDFIPHVTMAATFGPTSGTGTYAQLVLQPTINQTGGANGITRGLYVNPTLTAAADFRAIETTAGNVIFNGGNVGIGTSSPSYKLHVVGSAGFDNGASGDAITLLNGGFIQSSLIRFRGFSTQFVIQDNSYNTKFAVSTSGSLSYFNTGGNVAIGTTTDAGFKLDVNGTARVQGAMTISGLITAPSGLFVSGVLDIYNDGSNGAISMRTPTNTLNLRKYVKVLGDNGGFGNNDASAAFQIDGTNRGFLPPRMTQTQRNAIASPAIGLEIYQTDATEGKYIYKSSGWTYIG